MCVCRLCVCVCVCVCRLCVRVDRVRACPPRDTPAERRDEASAKLAMALHELALDDLEGAHADAAGDEAVALGAGCALLAARAAPPTDVLRVLCGAGPGSSAHGSPAVREAMVEVLVGASGRLPLRVVLRWLAWASAGLGRGRMQEDGPAQLAAVRLVEVWREVARRADACLPREWKSCGGRCGGVVLCDESGTGPAGCGAGEGGCARADCGGGSGAAAGLGSEEAWALAVVGARLGCCTDGPALVTAELTGWELDAMREAGGA
jgi:hypothetical protein